MNLNDCAYVRLTNEGEKILAAHYKERKKKARPAKWQRFQIHELMRIFGASLSIGFGPMPFMENEIHFIENKFDLTPNGFAPNW